MLISGVYLLIAVAVYRIFTVPLLFRELIKRLCKGVARSRVTLLILERIYLF